MEISMGNLFQEQAQRTPDHLAIVHNGQTITYAELNIRACRVAAYLIENCKINKEQLVGLNGSRSINCITGMLAAMLAGGAYVPLPESWPQARKSDVIKDAGLDIILSDDSSEVIGTGDIQPISIEKIFHEKRDFQGKLPKLNAEQLAYVMFTSGSTGKPKGVMIEHRNVLAMLDGFELVAPRPDALIGSALVSIGFDVSVWEIFSILCYGGTLHIIDHPEMIPEMTSYFCENQINSAYLPPMILGDFINEIEKQHKKTKMKRLLVGVEPIAQRTLQRFLDVIPDLRIINGYGPTETTICATFYPFENERDPERRTPIGKAVEGNQIYLVNEQLEQVKDGEEGEILICGAGVGRGYYTDADLTRSKFISDPFCKEQSICFRSGDYARMLSDGNLEFIGRKDQQVKISGYRIELGEIETALGRYPNLKQTLAIVGDKSGTLNNIYAYYTTFDNQPIKQPLLKEFLKEQLPNYMQPRSLVHLTEFPKNENGKIDRKRLPNPQVDNGLNTIAPDTPIESNLLNLFQYVFEDTRFGLEANFFDLGGNSLQAARLIGLISEKFSTAISFPDFYACASIKDLAEIIGTNGIEERKDNQSEITHCELTEKIPLSYSQERIWFMAQTEPDNPSVHSPFALRIMGKLNVSTLKTSLSILIERYDILRTVFYVENGVPCQRILPKGGLPFRQVDLSKEKNPSDELQTRITDLNLETFDISAAPPFRLTLFKLNRGEFVLAVIIHHIITDGWSAELFKRELSLIYEKLSKRKGISQSVSTLRYADYACWQKSEDFNHRIETQLDYWRKKLAGHADFAQLPNDMVRPLSKTSNGSTLWLSITGDLLEKLKSYSREHASTQFAVLLSAFGLAFSRHTHQDFIQMGSFFANRPFLQLENIMGPFVNGIILQMDLTDKPSFNKLVERVRTTVIEAQENQEVPIEKVIELVKVSRDQGQRTMFGVVFNFVNIPRSKIYTQSLELDYLDFDAGTVIYDLNVEFNLSETGLHFGFEYNTDIYHSQTIERLMQHFRYVLEQALEAPERQIGDYEILTSEEKEQINGWSGKVVLYPKDVPIHLLFEEQVRKKPDSIAVQINKEVLTYDGLNRRANQLARVLLDAGLKPEDFVGICLPKSSDMLVSVLAVIKAGGAYLPLDPGYPKENLAYIAQDAKPAFIITNASGQTKLPFEPQKMILLNDWAEKIQAAEYTNLNLQVQPDHLVYSIYTSGSTGRPKGVLIEHRSLVNFATGAQRYYKLTSADRVLQFASLNFDTSAEEIFPALISGATLVLRSEDMLDSIQHFIQRCQELGITVLDLPTAFWHEMVLYLEKSRNKLPDQIRLIIIGGERVSPVHLRTWFKLGMNNIHLDNTYGLTECTCVVSRCALTAEEREEFSQREATIGKAIDNVNLYVLDKELRQVPVGIAGELYIAGDCLARGYLNLPALTSQRFIPDPFNKKSDGKMYKTGDQVQWRPDGSLEYLGRTDEQIKIRGFRIEPGEIESVLIKFAGISDAVVLKRVDSSGTEQLLAYLVLEEGASFSERSLRSYAGEKLPKYMLPAYYQVMPEFPLSANGKIDKNALPDPDWSGSAQKDAIEVPRTPAEKKMLAIWEEALGRKGIGVEDNFFDIGGHSLLAARMMTEIESQFGVSVPLVVLLEKPTIRDLSRTISDVDWKPSWKSIVSLKTSGNQAPLFLVHAIGGDILNYRRLVNHLQHINRPIYGIRAQGLGGIAKPFNKIVEMAAFYIKEIKEIQPHGPYFLGGYSFGGTVIYEMAQQLIVAGETVSLLAMFDTTILENLPSEFQPNYFAKALDQLERFGFVIKKWLLLSVPKKYDYLEKVFRLLKNRFLSLIKNEKFINPQEQEDHNQWLKKPPAFQNVEMKNLEALSSYTAKPYPGKVTLFKARQREWSEMVNPEPLWRKLTSNNLIVYTIDGNHGSIFLEHNVLSLARELEKALEASEDSGKLSNTKSN
jgi:amino acid adenylation domain-containing protein